MIDNFSIGTYLNFRYELYKLDKISKAMNLEYEAIKKTVTQ